MARMTGSGRTVWSALPGGSILRVVPRPAGENCHVVYAEVGGLSNPPSDGAAVLAENIRVPETHELSDPWSLNLSLPGFAVIARCTHGKTTTRPVGHRAPGAVAENRHLSCMVPEILRPAVEAHKAAREGRRAHKAEEAMIAAALGRPMPRHR